MPERGAMVHISSAVVRALPGSFGQVLDAVAAMEGVEIAHHQDNKIIVVLEGPTAGTLGARLTEISTLDGVVSAVMVYEQIETAESLGEQA